MIMPQRRLRDRNRTLEQNLGFCDLALKRDENTTKAMRSRPCVEEHVCNNHRKVVERYGHARVLIGDL